MTSLGFDNKLICAALLCLFPSLSLSLSAYGSFRCLSSLFMNMQLVCKLKCYAALVLLYLLLTLNDFKYDYSISMFVTAAHFLCLFWLLAQSQTFDLLFPLPLACPHCCRNTWKSNKTWVGHVSWAHVKAFPMNFLLNCSNATWNNCDLSNFLGMPVASTGKAFSCCSKYS